MSAAEDNAQKILRELLALRGLTGEGEIAEFLSEKPKLTYDPLLLPDMGEAVDFLLSALALGKKICVYGDYDADGVCGTAVLVSFFRKIAGIAASDGAKESEISYYIPSRIEEGYGLNNTALKTIFERGDEVVLTVDCGSVSVAEVAYAREIGLEILITDHHQPAEIEPNCLNVNPKRASSKYLFDGLCGCAVGFKLCCALYDKLAERGAKMPPRAVLHDMLDLVGLATIADVMPLIDENRTIVKYGLEVVRQGKRASLAALLEAAHISLESIGARELSFSAAPRINAAGRLGDASEGVELFFCGDTAKGKERAKEIAEHMDALNIERQQLQKSIVDECLQLAKKEKKNNFLLLRPKNAHEGVSGIVAGRVREIEGKPCAVLTETDGGGDSADEGALFLKGSARSAGSLDLIALLRRHEEFFVRLGGHAAAAGFSLREENEEPLRKALNEDLAGLLSADPELLKDEEKAELTLAPDEITLELAATLAPIAPFGTSNPKPRIAFTARAEEIINFKRMGREGKHARFMAKDIPCIFFGGSEQISEIVIGSAKAPEKTYEIIGMPEINEWQGEQSLQFAVESLRSVS